MIKMFKIFKKSDAPVANEKWFRRWSKAGVEISAASSSDGLKLDGELVRGYLTQLMDDGLAAETNEGAILPWDSLYLALSNPAYAGLVDVLEIPKLVNAKPALRSSQSLADKDFSIAIGGWRTQ